MNEVQKTIEAMDALQKGAPLAITELVQEAYLLLSKAETIGRMTESWKTAAIQNALAALDMAQS